MNYIEVMIARVYLDWMWNQLQPQMEYDCTSTVLEPVYLPGRILL